MAMLLVLGACAPASVPAEFEVISLHIKPSEAVAGETVSITAEVRNTGGSEGTYTTVLTVDGATVETKEVALAPGVSKTVSFSMVKDTPGTYQVEVDGLRGIFCVIKPAEFTVSNLVINPAIAEVGRVVTISADVSNTGEVEGSYSATLKIDGSQVETKDITIAAGVTETVSFTFAKDAAGRYSIEVAGLTGLLKVRLLTETLKQLKAAYSELFHELLKLPDLEEIDAKDDETIEDITYLALDPKYKMAFESMLNEGIKEGRKYCAPLEALLWIAYDREFNGYNPLKDYSLQTLTSDAWKNTTTSNNYTSERWQNFDEVVDRLNSPDLVSIYASSNICYQSEAFNEYVPAKTVFRRKYNDCDGHATIQAYFLKANGYDAWNVGIGIEGPEGHNVCVYSDNGLYWMLDNCGAKKGSFKSLDELGDSVISGGSIIIFDPFDITSPTGNPFQLPREVYRK